MATFCAGTRTAPLVVAGAWQIIDQRICWTYNGTVLPPHLADGARRSCSPSRWAPTSPSCRRGSRVGDPLGPSQPHGPLAGHPEPGFASASANRSNPSRTRKSRPRQTRNAADRAIGDNGADRNSSRWSKLDATMKTFAKPPLSPRTLRVQWARLRLSLGHRSGSQPLDSPRWGSPLGRMQKPVTDRMTVVYEGAALLP